MAVKTFKYDDFCESCRKKLSPDAPILYVEEESGRYFCTEECIKDYFNPVADQFLQKHLNLRDRHDIAEARFSEYEKYVPLVLESPDEIWQDEGNCGEYFYYYITNFSDEGGTFWYIVSCFCMNTEPTFILLTVPTRDQSLVQAYRRGKKVRVDHGVEESAMSPLEATTSTDSIALASSFENKGRAIEEEMFRHRKKSDIPRTDFDDYHHLIEDTIESASEAWEMEGEEDSKTLTLISQQQDGVFYVVICVLDLDIEEGDSWRVVYSFPTKDASLVKRYRRGEPTEGFNEKYEFVH